MAKLQQYLPFTVLKRSCNVLIALIIVPAVATVLTVYGIETCLQVPAAESIWTMLQQYLPFTVLKRHLSCLCVNARELKLQQYLPFTVLKRETQCHEILLHPVVATVLTVYGIETINVIHSVSPYIDTLQQYLPFTVLKLTHGEDS